MFRLIRFLVGLALLGALGVAAVTVPLGEKTLWGHIKAIAGSKESKQLVDDVKKKATKVIESKGKGKGKAGKANGDQFTPEEREKLRKLIRDRLDDEKATTDGGKKTK